MKYFLAIIIWLPAFANFNRTSGLIDIPDARILPHLGYRIGFDLSWGIDQEHDRGFDENLHAAVGFRDFLEFYVDVYTFSKTATIAAGFCHTFYRQANLALAWGVHDLSYDLDISEVGHGDSVGWYDDLTYNSDRYEKPFELFSAFVVSSYTVNRSTEFTVGFGRGKFVGYGTHSKFLNSNFFHEQGDEWGIGIFGGVAWRPMADLCLMLDIDGRDFNTGLVYRYQPLEFSFGVAKLEHTFSQNYAPRLLAALSYTNLKSPVRNGAIVGTVFDRDGRPVGAEIGFSDADIPARFVDPELGTYSFSDLRPGIYEMFVTAKGYKTTSVKVDVQPGKTSYYDLELEPELTNTGGISGRVFNMKTGDPVKARVIVDKTKVFVTTDDNGLFKIQDLTPRSYDLLVEAEGYENGCYPVIVCAGDLTDVEMRMVQAGMNIVLPGINFEYNKATLRPDSYSVLDEFVKVLKDYPNLKIEIQGHTDSIGSSSYNLQLSNDRAVAVRNYLIEKHHIDPAQLIARGYGEEIPVGSNLTEAGRAQNRRVEFFILK